MSVSSFGKAAVTLLAGVLSVAPLSAQEAIGPAQTVPLEGGAPVTHVAQAAPAPSQSYPTDGSVSPDVRDAGYEMSEIVAAADGALGEASEAVAKVIERVFADLGRPNAYIVGREGSGAFILGLRYGQGELHSKIEGVRTVHWTGPSLGPDVGGDASRSFTLVYNLHDSEEIFRRFPAIEGRAYLIGGVSANYHQSNDIILVPIRLGAGWRLGANLGYLKYTRKGTIIPF